MLTVKLGLGIKKAVVADTSNGYLGYLTTPEEYSLQFYEGGSNFYGPNTGPYIATHMGHVAEELASEASSSDLPEKWNYTLSIKNDDPENCQTVSSRTTENDPEFIEKGALEESFWRFQWHDVPPAQIDFHRPLIRIEVSRDKTHWQPLYIEETPVDDEGPDIAVFYHSQPPAEQKELYEVRWNNPIRNGDYFRFAIFQRGNQDAYYSIGFQ